MTMKKWWEWALTTFGRTFCNSMAIRRMFYPSTTFYLFMVSEIVFLLGTHTLISIINLFPQEATHKNYWILFQSEGQKTLILTYMYSKLMCNKKTNNIQILKSEGGQHTYEELFYHPNSISWKFKKRHNNSCYYNTISKKYNKYITSIGSYITERPSLI